MRCFVVGAIGRLRYTLFALLMCGIGSPARAEETNAVASPAILTNLLQLRRFGEQIPSVLHPFKITASVLDADTAGGVLVLRDDSAVEFIQVDFRGQEIKPGDRICLEGSGCGIKPKNFGLAIVPRLVVDNNGIHGMRLASGSTFLHGGLNPITVQWFNGLGNLGLDVEYGGPGLLRQAIPSSALLRARTDPVTGRTNFSAGLDYRCYKGIWTGLPDFARLHPVKTGVATNFDPRVLTTNEQTALEFNGWINIPQDGTYMFYLTSDDGSRLFVGASFLKITVMSSEPASERAAGVPATVLERNSRPWVTLEGTVKFAGARATGGQMVMRVGSDEIRLEILEGTAETAPVFPEDAKVRVSGIYRDVVNEDGLRVPGMLLVSSWNAVQPPLATENNLTLVTNRAVTETASAPAAIQKITTASEVKALTTEMAKQQLPVTIRGVATVVLADFIQAVVIQDSTKGIYVSLENMPEQKPLRVGEFYQIQGVTGPGLFAPIVVAHRITHLGPGLLPNPLHATWDQLRNGSLDTQYAEIEGVVTSFRDHRIEMLTDGGMIALVLDDLPSEDLTRYENALVRIRGCAFAIFNLYTRELDSRSLRILGAAINVLEPAPHDMFDVPQKSLGELLLYDPKATPFRRLKVNGQIVYNRAREYFLTGGTNGLRVTTMRSNSFSVGDLVDAAGFLEFGPPAELVQAVLRKTGHAELPAPTKLAADQLLSARHIGKLVQVEATLVNQWLEDSEQVLGLQSGFLTFRARIDHNGQSIPLAPSGSRLELTGVYAAQGKASGDGTVSDFELLLASPTAIRVLATPPWWNLKRVLVLVGILTAILFAVLIWNKELHSKVEERGLQLETEIHNRQRVETQRAAEAERTRIARDLHDELGTGLTEVSLLASAGLGQYHDELKIRDRFHKIAEKARALVSGLDVIVWAIDPKRNSLQSFADYLGNYVRELLESAAIDCRLRIRMERGEVGLTEAEKHSLFLAVKEALNNIVRHASAKEVELQISQVGDRLRIVIADNGCGFDWQAIKRGNGLTNLQERLHAMRGECHIESQSGHGTTISFVVPVTCDRT